MTAAYASEAVASVSSLNNSVSVNKPSGTVSGDLLLGVVTTFGATPASLSSTGFTVLSTNDANCFVIYKIADGSEPASYTVTRTSPNSSTMAVVLKRYTGVDTTTPIAAVSADRPGNGTSVTIPSITATQADTRLDSTVFLSGATAVTFTPPSGMSVDFTDVDARTQYAGASVTVGAGATGTMSWSSSRLSTIVGISAAINSPAPVDQTVNAPAASATAAGAAPGVSADISSTPTKAIASAAAPGPSIERGASTTAPAAAAIAAGTTSTTVNAGSSPTATAAAAAAEGVAPSPAATSSITAPAAHGTTAAVGPDVGNGMSIAAPPATATADGPDATTSAGSTVGSVGAATASSAGLDAAFQASVDSAPTSATATATGRDAVAGTITAVTATVATATAATPAATPTAGANAPAPAASATATGKPATVTGGGSNQIVTVTKATATATGKPATFSRPNAVNAPAAMATAAGKVVYSGNRDVTINAPAAAATAAANGPTQSGGSDVLVVVYNAATATAAGAAISTAASTGVRLKARWHFFDPATGETWEFPINPNKMTSPHSPRNLKVFVNPPFYDPAIEARGGMARVFEGNKDVYEWSFSGYIRTEQHYRDLLYWSRKVNKLHLTDHLNRTWEVRMVAFSPDEKRPTLHRQWRMDYQIRAINYGAVA